MSDIVLKILRKNLNNKLPGEGAWSVMAPSGNRTFKVPENAGRAGVLILLFPKNKDLSIVFIKRTSYPGPHSGQISFPGGKTDNTDDSQIITALREAGEETGVNRNDIDIIGTLTPIFIPVSNLQVLPVIGFTNHSPRFNINKKEVEYLIEVSVKELLTGNNIEVRKIKVNGIKLEVPGYNIKNEFVWGATAMILAEFLEVIENIN